MFRCHRPISYCLASVLGLLPVTGQAIQRCTGLDGHLTFTDLACPEQSEGVPYKAHNPPPGSVPPPSVALTADKKVVHFRRAEANPATRPANQPRVSDKEAGQKTTKKKTKKKEKRIKYAPVIKRGDKRQRED